MKRMLYDADHDGFRDLVGRFAEREMVPCLDGWENAGMVSRDLYLQAGKVGLLGLPAPERFGGSGSDDFRYSAVLIEEMCRANVLGAAQGMILHTNIVLPYVLELGTEQQLERWVPRLCTGELLGAIAMTEPGTGSDLGAISTTAVRDGDHYRINGSKQFVSNGSTCDIVLVVCRTGESAARHNNLSLIAVEASTVGFSRGAALRKVGQHSADTAALFFDDVRVPADHLLGAENRGFKYLVSRLPQERLTIAITAVAHARAALDWTLAYAKERRAFGQPIASFQNNRFRLATMWTELELAQTYVDRQVVAYGSGDLSAEDAAAAKWWTGELNKRVLDECLQLHGGYGYIEDYPIARAWRDGRAMTIYGGTTEIMKELIGRRVLGV
jgi:alkylation response protein AidB-like acyl-CoA dehydrogenase